MNKYLSIVLSIVSNPQGVLLIDEIENGFYYRNLPVIVRSIIDLCNEYEVQIFATTPSYEFLQVLAQIVDEAEESGLDKAEHFTLMRLERSAAYQPTLKLVSGETYKAAIDQSFEVR